MKRLVLAGIGALSLATVMSAANAADLPRREQAMPVKAPAYVSYNWTGGYVGINGGYGWGRSNFQGVPTTGSFDVNGLLIGVTAGYNQQVGQAVFCIEADLDYNDMRGSAVCGAFTCGTRAPWLGTARGRIGYAFDRFMPYLTGGLAFGDIKASTTGFPGATQTKLGWTLGGGVEFALVGPWTAKLEYLYADLGTFDCGAACTATPPQNVSFRTNIVRAGINYRF